MDGAQARKAVVAGMIGNVLEWYDFAIYGYFAAAIGRQFFPREDPVAQLLAAFGVFAVGYLMRPIGGVIGGHIGDRFGRRAALTFSIVAMAIPTFTIGLLPGYETLGVTAPILFTCLRVFQGLSIGGEFTSSIVFLVERAPEGRRGLWGSFGPFGASGGILLGSAVAAGFAAMMSAQALDAWGWRIPFLLGLVVGLAGLLLRRHMIESAPTETRERAPIVETLYDHWRLVVRLATLTAFNAVGFYVSFVYVASWLQTADGIPPSRALEINTINMVVLLAVVVVGGWLSDRFGRKPFLLIPAIIAFVVAAPLFMLMEHPAPLLALLGQFGFALIVGTYAGVQAPTMAEIVPARVRCTAVALGYNSTMGVIGGLTPLAATWLVARSGDEIAPAFLIMAAAAISFLSALGLNETYRKPLDVSIPK